MYLITKATRNGSKTIHISMKLETILQILHTNDMMDVVALAVQIDNNLQTNNKASGDNIKVEVSKEQLTKMGLQRRTGDNERHSHWSTILLPVISCNQYALKKKYCVNIAGELKWVDESENSLSDVEPTSAPIASEEAALPQ